MALKHRKGQPDLCFVAAVFDSRKNETTSACVSCKTTVVLAIEISFHIPLTAAIVCVGVVRIIICHTEVRFFGRPRPVPEFLFRLILFHSFSLLVQDGMIPVEI